MRPQEPDAWWKEHSESWLQAHTEEAFWKEVNDPAYDVVLVGAISTLQPCCSSASDCSPTRQCLMDFRFCRLVCSLVPWLQALVARTQPLGFQWQVRRQSQVPEGAQSGVLTAGTAGTTVWTLRAPCRALLCAAFRTGTYEHAALRVLGWHTN